MGKRGDAVDQDLVRALAHPLRLRILQALGDGPSSPKKISELLGERLSNVSYHVRVLDKCNCVQLIDTRPARGALEHIYEVRPQLSASDPRQD
ncbi:MAG TPA: helix-turn-helix domain-containing protein [Solirubrobacterales bacterium]|nr:helix-turn-helix domain-containing protein [Solirubrobacterales bacterium]